MRLGEFLYAISVLVLASCGAQQPSTEASAPEGTVVRSTDFAILPCGPHELPSPCAVVLAGGKRVIVGAPAGVAADMSEDSLRNTDAVLLLSLRAEGVEGLDELRNGSWRAGREGPLPVGGPTGTGDFIGALNRAFEVSDSLIFVEDRPAGGFGAALLALLPGEQTKEAIVFDTGDLRITKIETGTSRAGYWVDYAGRRAVLEPCGVTEASQDTENSDYTMRCGGDWQLDEPVFVYRGPDL